MQFCISNRAIRFRLLTFLHLRVGEAKNPGPDDVPPGLLLGCFNPTGLLNKGQFLKDLPTGSQALWGVSETHLSPLGIRKFNKDLSFHNPSFHLLHGSPVPYRSTSATAIGGKQLGVGFLTNVPAKSLQPSWTEDEWNQSRFHVCAFFSHNTWVHGGVFYGHAFKADTLEVKQKTDNLLKILTDRLVLGMKGMRFIMGDFNQKDGSLPQTDCWRKLGWQEVQILGNQFHGRPISNTCKSKTIKDFIWISPEMIPHFHSVNTMDDIFPDHSVLYAKFLPWGSREKIPLWRKPKAIDWEKVQLPLPEGQIQQPKHAEPSNRLSSLSEDNPADVETPLSSFGTSRCSRKPFEKSPHNHTSKIIIQIANQFEERVNQAQRIKTGQDILMQQRGRSTTSQTTEVYEYSKPMTKSRAGDKQPNYFGTSLQYNRWFRQLRRLESYKRQTRSFDDMTWTQKVQQDRIWRSILSAPGFPLGFRKWWGKQHWSRANTPAEINHDPPTHQTACLLCIGFEEKVRALEDTLNNELVNRAKQNRITNPNKVFDDLKKAPANLVQLLDDSISTTIKAIDHDNNKLTVQPPVSFEIDTLVSSDNHHCKVLAIEDDKIVVDNTSELTEGSELKHEKYEASLGKLFEKFGKEWTKRWDKHLHVNNSHWDPIISFFKHSMQPIPSMQLEPITVELWLKTLKKKKAKAATGPDGWSRKDLLLMPRDLIQQILNLLQMVEEGQPWPDTMVTGIVHSLEKVPFATKTSQFRPITIFSLIYRTWSSIRSKQCLQHLIDHVPTKCYGNLPGRQAGQVWWGILQSIEDSHYTGHHLTGAMIDIVKCFNALPRCPLLAVCSHLGIHKGIIKAWMSGLAQMTRRFSIRGGVGPPLKSSTGFAEGCGLSVVAMVASNVLTSQWLLHKVPTCDLWTYVDNIELTSPDMHRRHLML